MTTSTKKLLIGALVVPAIALAAACTSGSNDAKARTASDSGGVSAPGAVPAPPPADTLVDASADGAAPMGAALTSRDAAKSSTDAVGKTTTEVQSASVISKGQVSLRSKDIDAARFDLQKLLDSLGGTIADEQSNADKQGRTIRQRLVLRVPSEKFSKAMDGISKLPGVKLVSRSRSSEDVTTQVIDNRTRIRTQRASLARVQALLAQAATVNQIISIESQLSRRQAQLDSLEAQQKYLADQTSLSTINVYLTVPEKKSAGHKDDHGFFSGLRSGWDQLGSSTSAVLTGVGAVLPFAVLLALIGFPAWAIWRRRALRAVPAEV